MPQPPETRLSTAECRNCGTALSGAYCSSCGQTADVTIPSLRQVIVEALGDLYNFDSRLWRTLLTLLFRPGGLTRRYLEGRRARYVPPFKLYIVSSLIFFLLLSLEDEDAAENDPDYFAETADVAEQPASSSGPEADAAVEGGEEAAPPPPSAESLRRFGIEFSEESGQNRWSCEPGDGLPPELRPRFELSCAKIAEDSGASLSRALADKIPLMMLLFIPIVSAGMKVLYPLSRRKYVEHLMFFLHYHTFFFLLATLAIVVSWLGDAVPALGGPATLLVVAGWLYLPVYLFLAMRHFYGQGRLATTAKLALLGGGYMFSLIATFVAVFLYTMLTL